MIGLHEYLIVAALLFFIGMAGVIGRKNLFIIFMSVELMLNAANLTFLACARYQNRMDGQALAFLVLAVAAAEAALGLAIVILIYRNRQTLNIDEFARLKE